MSEGRYSIESDENQEKVRAVVEQLRTHKAVNLRNKDGDVLFVLVEPSEYQRLKAVDRTHRRECCRKEPLSTAS